MLLQFQERRIEPDIVAVEIAGRLALGRESQRIEALIEDLARRGEHNVIFDLRQLEYIDSAGIGMLALCAGKAREGGGKCVAVVEEGRVRKLLKLTQLDAIVPTFPTVETAAANFGRGSAQAPASA